MKIATNRLTDDYFRLLHNLNNRTKLELISKLTDSLLEPSTTKQEEMLSCFGRFISEQSADELVMELRNARQYRKTDIEL